MKDRTNQNIRRSYYQSRQALKQIADHLPSFVIATETTPEFSIIHTFSRAIRGVAYYRCNFPTIRANRLTDLVVTDNLKEPARFTLKYRLYSSRFNARYAIIFNATAYRAIPSRRTPFKNGKAIFAAADWLEREAWDLYGVYFKDSPEMRRLLTDYGFEGHPLRKDFPVAGFIEYAFDPISGCVYIVGAEFSQELREFRDYQL